ncbi:hypothetical protein ElyMa_005298300 [Elysia marginata]|uniref:Uncharacterized protein n=1 Tax=Elysia marginata TaxID=1093978 RepID=A0AAV4K185_9GAST|nr:hypothetical protein ElyMa_005298300 [Elysia marginata]
MVKVGLVVVVIVVAAAAIVVLMVTVVVVVEVVVVVVVVVVAAFNDSRVFLQAQFHFKAFPLPPSPSASIYGTLHDGLGKAR